MAIASPIETVDQWCQLTEEFSLMLSAAGIASAPTDYTVQWLARACLDPGRQLKITNDGPELLARFMHSAPDQRQHMAEVVAELRPCSVRELVTMMNYEGRLQHLSCWMCFAHGLPALPASVPLQQLRDWRRDAIEFTREHGWPPHPVPLLQGNLVPKALSRGPDDSMNG